MQALSDPSPPAVYPRPPTPTLNLGQVLLSPHRSSADTSARSTEGIIGRGPEGDRELGRIQG